MSGGYQTGAPELRQAAGRMENTNETLQGNIKQLGQILDSIEGQWEGKARKSFDTLLAAFLKDAKDLNDSLNHIATEVTGSADLYDKQEEESAQDLSKLTQVLGGYE